MRSMGMVRPDAHPSRRAAKLAVLSRQLPAPALTYPLRAYGPAMLAVY